MDPDSTHLFVQNGVGVDDVGPLRVEEGDGREKEYDVVVLPPLGLEGQEEALVFLVYVARGRLQHLQFDVLEPVAILLNLPKGNVVLVTSHLNDTARCTVLRA